MATITRTMFCQRCYNAGRPQCGNIFVVYGNTRECFIVRRVFRRGVRGFTPHTIFLDKVGGEHVHVSLFCGVEKCGDIVVEIDNKNNPPTAKVHIISTIKTKLKIKNWNALVMYKNDPCFML